MKVLHITSWYPGIANPTRAIFIKKQIEALDLYCQNQILHFEVVRSNWFKIERKQTKNLKQTIVHSPIYFWSLIEIIHLIWLYLKLVVRKEHQQYDLINFHIAYPMLSYWHLIKKKIKKPVVITEHWSAYKNNFGVNKELPIVKNIFCQNIPLIAVSNVLISDIQEFSKCNFSSFVVPNVIDSSIFYPISKKRIVKNSFLMCGFWKEPKKPMLALEAFKENIKINPDLRLNIIGNGPMVTQMADWIKKNHLGESIFLLGNKLSKEIADLMRASDIFLHPTEYETFSVVCAEALSCGLPVIASNKGAIPEVVGDSGILIENTNSSWTIALKKVIEGEIKTQASWANPYNKDTVGKKYFDTLISIKNDSK